MSLVLQERNRHVWAQTSADRDRHYPKTDNPWPQIPVSFCGQWREPRMAAQVSLVVVVGLQLSTRNSAGGVAATKSQPHDKPRLGEAPGALTLNSSSAAEARCIFLLDRGQFPLLFPSESSPLPLISSTSLARVSLSSLSILDTSVSAENQREGRQNSLLKVEIARLGDCQR